MDAAARDALLAAFGPARCELEPAVEHYTAYGGSVGGRPLALLRPRSPEDVVAMVRHCAAARIGMVPQGGRTGLAAGAVPTAAQADRVVVIAMGGLDRVREIDPVGRTATVDAGCTLDAVEAAVTAHGLTFPLRLGSSGSAEIGGIIASNAGGIQAWRHGSARQLVLGIEAVLADGSLWSSLRAVRKASLGPDIGGLFIGSEGILGIVTGAVLALATPAAGSRTTLLALADADAAAPLFRLCAAGGELEAFELLSRNGLGLLAAAEPELAPAMLLDQPWTVLAEWSASDDGLGERVEAILARALDAGLAADGLLARHERDRSRFWQIRGRHGAACRRRGRPVQHDVAVPLAALGSFLDAATALARRLAPDWLPVPIAHVGDGNIHFDLVPAGTGAADHAAVGELSAALHDLAHEAGGVFSAEHGIGATKVAELRRLTPPGNYAAMRAVKAALDPLGLMNPLKVLA
ncbi:MAG: FAD-binding oxidoreductase [Geminicoccaceae bacterium]